jgi:hypothetical protein
MEFLNPVNPPSVRFEVVVMFRFSAFVNSIPISELEILAEQTRILCHRPKT